VGLEWVWGLLQPGFVRWAPPPASQNHFNHWVHGNNLQEIENREREYNGLLTSSAVHFRCCSNTVLQGVLEFTFHDSIVIHFEWLFVRAAPRYPMATAFYRSVGNIVVRIIAQSSCSSLYGQGACPDGTREIAGTVDKATGARGGSRP